MKAAAAAAAAVATGTVATGTVVTGLGVIAPNGIGTEEYWAATLAGKSGIGVIQRFDASAYPVRVGGEVLAFDADAHLPKRLMPQTDRMTQYALAAADWALTDAGLVPADLDEYGLGVLTAGGCGGFEFGQREMQKLWGTGPERVSAYQSFAWFYAVNSGQISIRHGMRGHSSVFVSEQAGALDAAAHTARLLRKGELSAALTGGFEASICPWGLVAQLPSGFLSTVPDPGVAYLPFDAAAAGYVPGEGGALMAAEREDTALRRGAARIYGRIAGHASTFDPRPGSGRPPGLARAIREALREARIDAADVDVVFADALGVPALDRAEADALAQVFGPSAVPVTAPKTLTGRLYAGGAALDAATALLSIRDSVIPPTVGTSALAPGLGIDLVLDAPRETPVRNALVIARGTGGFNAALVLQRYG
ncbi:beta-ketoacyl synthase [Streptomyces sp. CB03234]|uniref:ketosynthase chain-length factor n=1 Tax=Streptomyces sp. (strain CB03234) TaxID=1703937 RepID=UPI00093E5969|nr:ketosynthase chain-length factor [Streptomyces sp. CB03234]OKK03846.1 beta-ketoacyl synthase [Streptomyces sp. CB03234]